METQFSNTYYICLDTSYHFLALSLLLKYSSFLSSTPALTSSIDVVFILSTYMCHQTSKMQNKQSAFGKEWYPSKINLNLTSNKNHICLCHIAKLSNWFEILYSAWQCHCHALCKIVKQFDKRNGYSRRRDLWDLSWLFSEDIIYCYNS